jgi:hypothetical protein
LKMNLLAYLTEDLVVSILADFIELRDVLLLDSALCNLRDRPRWVSVLQSPQFKIMTATTTNIIKWSTDRGVKVQKVQAVLRDDLQSSLFRAFVAVSSATLRSVELSGLTNDSELVQHIVRTAVGLKAVSIDDIPLTVEDFEAILSLAEVKRVIVCYTNIALCRPLLLPGPLKAITHLCLIALNIDDDFITGLAVATPLMAVINLSMCKNLTDLAALTMALHWPHIEWAKLSYVPFTDAGMVAVVRRWSQLQVIYTGAPLTGLNEQTVAVAFAVVDNCRSIEELHLDGVGHITSEFVYLVAVKCPLLRVFSIVDAPGVDDNCLVALISGCPLLTEIGLPVNSRLTWLTLQHIAQQGSHVRRVKFRVSLLLPKRDVAAVEGLRTDVQWDLEAVDQYDDEGNILPTGNAFVNS